MANKNIVRNIPFNGLLNLNRYRNEIRDFNGFNEKNSPIYGGVLSPFYETDSTTLNSKQVFVGNHIYEMIQEDSSCFLKERNLENGSTEYNTLNEFPLKNLIKESINVPYKILAFDRKDEDEIWMFVEKNDEYALLIYNTTTKTYTSVNTYSLSKISKVELRYGIVCFIDYESSLLVCLNKDDTQTSSLSLSNLNIDDLIITINRLGDSFKYDARYRYLISICGESGQAIINSPYSDNRIITFTSDDSFSVSNKLTIKEYTYSTVSESFLPSFALTYTDDNITLYFVNVNEINTSRTSTYYLTGTPHSYDTDNDILYLDCDNTITLDDTTSNQKVNPSMDLNSYFYSIIIGVNRVKTYNNINCANHHVLFDSSRKHFIGNCGYIKTDDNKAYVPYGDKVNVSDNADFNFSFLINNSYISNIAITDMNSDNDIGTILTEWNFIDGEINPKVYSDSCIYKITNENKINIIKLIDETPDMEVMFNRYIVIKTPSRINIYDTTDSSFYHSFVDYNNRIIPCERYGETTIEHFPYRNADTNPFTMSEVLKNYLYVSGINPLMEVSKLNMSSIQYNPSVINYGSYTEFDINGYSGASYYNEAVDVFLSDSLTDTIPLYYRTFIVNKSFINESLYNLPYPITSSGNILYSANLFSRIINSYSNKDMIINDNVAYPILYINNQPSFDFYFLSGIEFADSCFVLHGMNYVNTNNFIFSTVYNGDVIASSEALVSIEGYKFLGNNTKMAFYYCKVKKSIYAFYGDRTLEKLYDCNEINDIKSVYFNPNNYNIYIITDSHIYVIDEDTLFKMDILNATKMYFSDKFIFIEKSNSNYSALSYEFIENVTTKKIPVKIATQYYGVGNNIKSVVDCIYIRLFNQDSLSYGKVTLHVSTMTDCGMKTEDKVFDVKSSDWDIETDTIYLRYQPKYQECTGMSVFIESDFAIATLDIGYGSDGTIQISKNNI